MGLYLRPSRLLKVRISKRRTRVGIGARWLRRTSALAARACPPEPGR